MDHRKNCDRIDPNTLHVGKVPPTEAGRLMQSGFQHLRAWRQNEVTARYSGRATGATPASSFNGNPGTGVNSMYIISRLAEKVDKTARQCGISLKYWSNPFVSAGSPGPGVERDVLWYDDWTDGVADLTYTSQLGNIATDTELTGANGMGVSLVGSVTPSTSVLADGDMEAAGVGDWTAGNSATLTKQTTDPYQGSQVLRVTRNGVNNPYAYQTITTAYHTYRVRGFCRSDGLATPSVGATGASVWTAPEISTEWKYFDETFYSSLSGELRFFAVTATGTQYVEWDQVTVHEYESFKVSKLTSDYCYLAAATVYPLPDVDLTDENGYDVTPAKMVPFEGLRGATSADPGTSVGRVAWGLERGDAMVQDTARCLFQTFYPTGAFANAGTSIYFQEDSNGNPLLYDCRPRNLQELGVVEADIAMIVNTATAGDTITYHSLTNTDTWTWTCPAGGIATPTMITTANGTGGVLGVGRGIQIDTVTDKVKISTDGTDVHVNTFSLWERERV